jgi:hypothetical protein
MGNTPGMWESIGNIWEDVYFGGGFRLFGHHQGRQDERFRRLTGSSSGMPPVDVILTPVNLMG